MTTERIGVQKKSMCKVTYFVFVARLDLVGYFAIRRTSE